MKDSLRPGVSRTSRIVIDRERTIGFMGEEGRVYATPRMVWDVEHACRDLLMEYSDGNEDSVGIEVTLRHLAPTLPGMTVDITVTVRSVEGRKVAFDFEVKDNLEAVGAGSHSRFVVDKAKTIERLKAKAAKFAALQ